MSPAARFILRAVVLAACLVLPLLFGARLLGAVVGW